MLRVAGLSARYGSIPVLRKVSFHVEAGEIVALVGSNGAGKSTLLRTLSGLHPLTDGTILFRGRPIQSLSPATIVRLGLVQVPEARQLFPNLTVLENLELGGYIHGRKHVARCLEGMFSLFPVLSRRKRQKAGTLSGGEQQMLSIARALMAKPALLLLDEPSLGLAPLVIDEIYGAVLALSAQGVTILLVEQNAMGALGIARRAYVLENGRIVLAGDSEELMGHDDVRRAYLGRDYRHKWER
ncbi:MAG TPA: ABC transporter ATP-binding protein [Syntrophobacteraceae bacterium]|nr:ABC transporter ATP-binding protein [Syntrophobacteraceae bacterium]